jgi:hypothetical protein
MIVWDIGAKSFESHLKKIKTVEAVFNAKPKEVGIV